MCCTLCAFLFSGLFGGKAQLFTWKIAAVLGTFSSDNKPNRHESERERGGKKSSTTPTFSLCAMAIVNEAQTGESTTRYIIKCSCKRRGSASGGSSKGELSGFHLFCCCSLSEFTLNWQLFEVFICDLRPLMKLNYDFQASYLLYWFVEQLTHSHRRVIHSQDFIKVFYSLL